MELVEASLVTVAVALAWLLSSAVRERKAYRRWLRVSRQLRS